MKKLQLILLALALQITSFSQTTQQVAVDDLKQLTGFWKGTLTYLDYSSGKPYTMPANLEVSQLNGSAQFRFLNSYPDEPHANSADTIRINENGTRFNQERMVSRKKRADGSLEIVTHEPGTDGNDQREALFRHTYTISATQFIRKKEVQFKGTKIWIKRHEYRYSR